MLVAYILIHGKHRQKNFFVMTHKHGQGQELLKKSNKVLWSSLSEIFLADYYILYIYNLVGDKGASIRTYMSITVNL